MNLDIKNKRAMVCGSTQGIGKAVAMQLAAMGAHVTLVARNEQSLKQTKSELPNNGNQLHSYICADFSDTNNLKELLGNFIQRIGPVNILVNNTGGPPSGPITMAKNEEFCRHLIIILFAIIFWLRLVLRG